LSKLSSENKTKTEKGMKTAESIFRAVRKIRQSHQRNFRWVFCHAKIPPEISQEGFGCITD
jgi:hypothetical protein